MNELPLRLNSQFISLLDNHTALTEQRNKVVQEIKAISTANDTNKFADLPASAPHISQLHEMIARMESNLSEEEALRKRSSEAKERIAALQGRSKTLSIIAIVAVIILILLVVLR